MVELMNIQIVRNILQITVNTVNYEFVNNKIPSVFIIYCKYDGLSNFNVS